MYVPAEILMMKLGEWKTLNLTAERDLGDGTCLLAAIQKEVDKEGERRYRTTIYRVEYNRDGLIQNCELLRLETFGYMWNAIRYCEEVDLGDLITKE